MPAGGVCSGAEEEASKVDQSTHDYSPFWRVERPWRTFKLAFVSLRFRFDSAQDPCDIER